MDIVQPQQRLRKHYAEATQARREAAGRRSRKGSDEFQLGLEEQNGWWLDRLDAKQAQLDALRAALVPELAAYCDLLLA